MLLYFLISKVVRQQKWFSGYCNLILIIANVLLRNDNITILSDVEESEISHGAKELSNGRYIRNVFNTRYTLAMLRHDILNE